MDAHHKRATSTQVQGFRVIKDMIHQALVVDDREELARVRSNLGSLGAVSTIVKAFSAVHDDVKSHKKPTPSHPIDMIQLGCHVLELLTSERVVHEDNLKRCSTDKIIQSLLQVLDNHTGDEFVIENILHLLIHIEFDFLKTVCRLISC